MPCAAAAHNLQVWVSESVPGSTSTGKNTSVGFAVGSVAGPVETAPLVFAEYSVPDQAFLYATVVEDFTSAQGLIGLGPSSGSQVRSSLGTSAGDPVLDRIFQQNTSTPNYLTVALGRSDDPDEPFPGNLTVGEVLPGYEDLLTQPKLDVTSVPTGDSDNQHWQVLLDEDGIIGPDGGVIPITSGVNSTQDRNRATVIFDTGYTLPQVPKSVSDAIYSNVSGAKLMNVTEGSLGLVWTLPCDQELNLTFKFGGNSYPIHPLDTCMDVGLSYCVGAFQGMASPGPTYDMILGMAFLRNVQVLFNFGDFVDGSNNTAEPYVQLLSTTNDTTAVHNDFVKVRDTATNHGSIAKYIIIAAVAGGLIVVLALIGLCGLCMRRRSRKAAQGGMFSGGSYRRLNEPAPPVDLHVMSSSA